MKDGTTHLAYKAEHAVDLETEMIVAAEIYHADQADPQTLEDTLQQAKTNLHEAGSDTVIREVPADKGYHAAATLAAIREHTPYRTYIPEPQREHDCRWTDKPSEQKEAVYANRRRTRGHRGKQLQRLRSERSKTPARATSSRRSATRPTGPRSTGSPKPPVCKSSRRRRSRRRNGLRFQRHEAKGAEPLFRRGNHGWNTDPHPQVFSMTSKRDDGGQRRRERLRSIQLQSVSHSRFREQ
jgi:hypothetical protein